MQLWHDLLRWNTMEKRKCRLPNVEMTTHKGRFRVENPKPNLIGALLHAAFEKPDRELHDTADLEELLGKID